MEPKDVIKISTMEAFYKLRDSLNLTDRQRIIFELRYSRGMFLQDIATELEIDKKTVRANIKIIDEKLKSVSRKNLTSDEDNGIF